MARKCNALELLPAIQLDAMATGRTAGMIISALNILQPPPRALKIPSQRRRVEIVVDSGSQNEIAEPVKIRHDD